MFVVNPAPKNLTVGTKISAEIIPPPNIYEAMRGPMMYPTPNNSGEISAATRAP